MRKLTKLMCLALLYIMVALLINYGWKLVSGQSINLWSKRAFGVLCGTLILLLLYTFWICRASSWMFWKEDVFKGRMNVVLYFALYLIVVVLPVVGAHTLLLHVIMETHKLSLMQSRYWTAEFMFFLLPVMSYAVVVYFYPQYKLFKGELGEENGISDLQKWEYSRNTAFLRMHLRRKYPQEPSFLKNSAVMLLYVVFVEKVDRYDLAYLLTGEKIIIDPDRGVLEECEAKNWIVKISETVQVNMLYVDWPIKNFRKLRLEEEVWYRFRNEGIELDKLKELIDVGRRMEDNVKKFIATNTKMGDAGWDTQLRLLK